MRSDGVPILKVSNGSKQVNSIPSLTENWGFKTSVFIGRQRPDDRRPVYIWVARQGIRGITEYFFNGSLPNPGIIPISDASLHCQIKLIAFHGIGDE